MDAFANTVKELTRRTSSYKVPVIDVFGLISLSSRLKGEVPKVVRFEKIVEALHLGIKEVKSNWKSTGTIPGLYLCFLISKAEESAKKEHWDDFIRFLVAMIYGIMRFPSKENFVSLSAICVFMNKNLVPTLLADTYVSMHSRHGKGGYIWKGGIHCWLLSPFVVSVIYVAFSSERAIRAQERWNYCVGKVWNIITSCGQYSNVPLVGTRGCINYNPMLAYRQLGYAMEVPPKDVEMVESVYFAEGEDLIELEKIGSAWTKVHKKDQTSLSKKFPISMGPYRDWIKERIKYLLLPFAKSDPLYEHPPVLLSDIVPAELYTQAKADNIKLQAKDREVDLENYFQDQEKGELAR
ncbi:uncharacterized protein LOC131643018 [Vicia villosa]|uniref:uncharacterized protein LOC131643018 n=1 Tax=Vicia villosa TaxID=3911 RepID=UPI00273A900C|nr:uncharacterized protein LOC131643018 [Vicia villosa]